MGAVPRGVFLQLYRGKSGYSDRAMASHFQEWKDAGIDGVLAHGFVGELSVGTFETWATPVDRAGLRAGAAFGLGRRGPHDAGMWMGRVFSHSLCQIGLLDAEGAFDSGALPDAALMCQSLEATLTPNSLCAIGDQPWMVPTLHSGFPYEAFNAVVGFNAEQLYVLDFPNFGTDAYPHCAEWSGRTWAELERQRLAPKQLARPHCPTLQGEPGWDKYPWHLVNHFMLHPTVFLWCEPWPDEVVLMCLRAARFLQNVGLSVEAFQQSHGLTPDGKCGFATMAAMGIKRRSLLGRTVYNFGKLLLAT